MNILAFLYCAVTNVVIHHFCRNVGMMDPNGNELPYPTISYANGPGFNDHFDNVRIVIFLNRYLFSGKNIVLPGHWILEEHL